MKGGVFGDHGDIVVRGTFLFVAVAAAAVGDIAGMARFLVVEAAAVVAIGYENQLHNLQKSRDSLYRLRLLVGCLLEVEVVAAVDAVAVAVASPSSVDQPIQQHDTDSYSN